MERKKIGMSSSEFYSLWADCEKAYDPDNAKLILKKAAVGVVPRAPTTPEAAVFDDGEVVIEKVPTHYISKTSLKLPPGTNFFLCRGGRRCHGHRCYRASSDYIYWKF